MRLLLVDDHRLFRQGLTRLLREHPTLRVVGEAASAEEALERARELKPDMVLMDVNLPGTSGIEAVRLLKRELPEIQVVMLSMSDRDEDLMGALRAGAAGFVPKTTDFDALISSLEGVAKGQPALSRALTARVLAHLNEASAPPATPLLPSVSERLSAREREILTHLAHGASNKQIARQLALSEHTVRSHITNILSKLNLENRVQAAAYALQHGLG